MSRIGPRETPDIAPRPRAGAHAPVMSYAAKVRLFEDDWQRWQLTRPAEHAEADFAAKIKVMQAICRGDASVGVKIVDGHPPDLRPVIVVKDDVVPPAEVKLPKEMPIFPLPHAVAVHVQEQRAESAASISAKIEKITYVAGAERQAAKQAIARSAFDCWRAISTLPNEAERAVLYAQLADRVTSECWAHGTYPPTRDVFPLDHPWLVTTEMQCYLEIAVRSCIECARNYVGGDDQFMLGGKLNVYFKHVMDDAVAMSSDDLLNESAHALNSTHDKLASEGRTGAVKMLHEVFRKLSEFEDRFE
jgi:hypothetical protein